ncbi:polysaccharide biosynthesis protein [Nostoc sp. T09]|uniref:oligosaccharide flippase family protein n=1 Tax=Nostoc sp. T09 TaxID=1932621 RepID=UPI000A3BDAFA|nr:oligosaccharide flippase family protein [Nostoc sp. T09]OUL37163.1 polysaccharide biosynthesis protein [Nostoc sp. T09]
MANSKLLKNSLSLLINRITQGITTFVITAAIARNLGASELGQYTLAISYYYIFVTIASQGLKTLFTRELARKPEEIPVYLVNGTLLQLSLSIIGYLLLVVVVFLLPYSDDTSMICYIMGLSIVPFALSNITEAIFQAQEKMHLIAISTVPIYILRLLAMLWCLPLKYAVSYIAGIIVLSETLILLIEWVLLTRAVKPKWNLNKDFFLSTLYSVRTFFAIDAAGMIASKIDILTLSLLGSEFLLGLYGAIGQLMQPYMIVSNSVSLAAFPNMSKAVALGRENQRKVTENIISVLLCMGLPFIIGLLFFGSELLTFVYQNQSFSQVAIVLYISSISIITSTFCRSLSYLLIANGLEKFNLLEVAITCVVGGLAGIILIPQYKLIGAALMSLIMSLTNFSLYMYIAYKRLFSLRVWQILRQPLLISSLMTIVFLILKKTNTAFLLTLIISISVYGLFMGLGTVHQFGGFYKVWQKISRQGKYAEK